MDLIDILQIMLGVKRSPEIAMLRKAKRLNNKIKRTKAVKKVKQEPKPYIKSF